MRPLLLATIATCFSTAALAADPVDVDPVTGETVTYKPVTEHNFEVVDVKAGVVGPDITLFIEPKRQTFPPAFRLREHFEPEMLASIDRVK